MDVARETGHFEHRGWQVRIYMGWNRFERRFAGRAELFSDGVMHCRIALGKEFDQFDGAAASLRHRACAFIEDWYTRAHFAESEFSDL